MRVVIAREPGAARLRLRQTVHGLGLHCAPADCVLPDNLTARLLEAPAELVLVGLGTNVERGLAAIRQAAGQIGTPIFAVAPGSNTELMLQSLRAGASEFIHEEKAHDEIFAALAKMHRTGHAGLQWGQFLAVLAARPGSGVTTIAANLAHALAERHPGRVALAELTAACPELALDLDVTPPHGVDELLTAGDRLDATMLRQALVPNRSGPSLLLHRPDTLEPAGVAAATLRQALVLLQTMFDYSVLDLGHQIDAARLEALALVHRIVLVVTLDVPCLRRSRLLLSHLEEKGIPAGRFHIVANRYGQRRQLPWKRAQEALGVSIHEWVLDDPARINDALNRGLPLLQAHRRCRIGRSFLRLARQLSGRPAPPQGMAG